jgi:thymidylate kinase
MTQNEKSLSLSTDIKKVVITGGPVAGKTTAVEYLRGMMPDAVTIPEVATALVNGGYPMPGDNLQWTEAWQEAFQDAIFHVQRSVETVKTLSANQKGCKLIIADRGLIDGAAYFKGGRNEFAERYGLDIAQVMTEYDTVIHLESIAIRSRSMWEVLKGNNPTRFRSYDEVLALEQSVREAWEGHPNRIIVDEHNLDDRLFAVEGIVKAINHPRSE